MRRMSGMLLLSMLCNRYRKLPRFSYWAYNKFTQLEIRTVHLVSNLTIKERTAAALAWHAGHWPCDWCSAATIQYQFEQHSFVSPLPGPARPNDRIGWHWASARVFMLCFAPAIQSATVLILCLIEFVPSWLVQVTIPLSCLPILVFLQFPAVLSRAGLFAA